MKLLPFILIFGFATFGQQNADLKVMTYNLLNFSGNDGDRVDYLKTTLQKYQPDLLVVNELVSEAGGNLILNSALNTGIVSHYSFAPFIDGYDSDNGLFYDHSKLVLTGQEQIETSLRDISQYDLYSIDSTGLDTAFITVFSVHLKAGSSESNAAQRAEECIELMNHLSTIPNTTNVIVCGDFNFYGSDEAGYQTLLSSSSFSLNDPLGHHSSDYIWHNDFSYAGIHTQSTRVSIFGGGSNGGLDDRFDFILVSDPLLTGTNKIKSIVSSYKAYGNDGNHFNSAVNYAPASEGFSEEEMNALHNFSDHLPVVLEFELFPEGVGIKATSKNSSIYYETVNNEVQLTLLSDFPFSSDVFIYDVFGKLIYSDSLHFEKGINQHSFSIHMEGVYFIHIPSLNHVRKIFVN